MRAPEATELDLSLSLGHEADGEVAGSMRSTGRRGLFVAAVLALLTLATITAASAYWSSPGSGSGSASSGTAQAVTVSPATAVAQLFPGGQGSVALTVTNPNLGSVRIGSFVLDTGQGSGGFAVDASHAGCGLSSLSFTTQTNGDSGWNVAAGGPVPLNLPGSLSMSATASDACQGATLTVYLRVAP